MKRWKKIVGGTLVVLAAVGAGAAWHFQNELQAVNYYLRYSQEEQAVLEQENEAMLENVLQQANLPAEIFTDPSLTTEEIAQKLRELLASRDQVNIMFGAAPSQNETLATLVNAGGIDWSRVNAFHMDEYVGLPTEHRALFGKGIRGT